MRRIENVIFYANVGQDNFRKLYPKIQSQMLRDNRSNLVAFVHAAVILLLLALGVSFLTAKPAAARALYVFMLCICAALLLMTRNLRVDSLRGVRWLMYAFSACMILFSIILGTVFSPDELASTFAVIMISAPLIFADRPIYFLFVLAISYAAFMTLTLIFDVPSILTTELINATVFTIFAMGCCVYTMNVKLQKYFLEYANRIAVETDALTELCNRKCYEEAVRAFDTEKLSACYYIFVDVNGLHEMNDNQGHRAGDRMLITVAQAFREQFGDKTYRVGGDEFLTFGWDKTPEEVEQAVKAMLNTVESSGYYISVGVAFGTQAENFRQLVQLAEADMYRKKAEYYMRTGKDRRRI